MGAYVFFQGNADTMGAIYPIVEKRRFSGMPDKDRTGFCGEGGK